MILFCFCSIIYIFTFLCSPIVFTQSFFIVSSFSPCSIFLLQLAKHFSLSHCCYKTVQFCSLLSHTALAELFKNKSGQPHIFLNFSRPISDSAGIWESDDANPPHAPISVTEYRPKGQSDVTLLFFFTFLIRQGILHHQRRAIKVSLA